MNDDDLRRIFHTRYVCSAHPGHKAERSTHYQAGRLFAVRVVCSLCRRLLAFGMRGA